MWTILRWDYQIVELEFNEHCNEKLLNSFYAERCLEKDQIVSEANAISIFNHKSFMYFEAEYILQQGSRYFTDVVDKLCDKRIDDKWYYFSPTKEAYIENVGLSEEVTAYANDINNNNISLHEIERDKITISPFFFNVLKKNYELNDKEKSEEIKILNYMTELFSLFVLAEKTTLEQDLDGCTIAFIFEIRTKGSEKKVFKVTWADWDFFKQEYFFDSYRWIRENDKILINNDVKLEIVRGEISRGKSFSVNKDSVSKYRTILNRIINNETKEYFEQQNKLKEEYIELNKMKLESSRQLRNKLLGLITTISVAFYGLVYKNDGTLNISAPNDGLALLFLCAAATVAFFFLVQIIELWDRKKMYLELKNIYVDKLNFDREDYDSTVHEPDIFDLWKDFLIALSFFILLILLMRYFLGGVEEVKIFFKQYFKIILWEIKRIV